MNKKRTLLGWAGITAALLLFGVCVWFFSGGHQHETDTDSQETSVMKESDEVVIGCTLASGQSYYQEALGTLMENFAAYDGSYTLDIRYASWSVEEQEEQMRDFISKGVDAIILCPVNAKSFLNVLKDARTAGIPVINLNMKLDMVSSEYIETYVGASMSEEAEMAAELAIEYFGGEEGQIGIIEGIPGSDPSIYRTQTFLEKLTSHPNIEVVGIANGEWEKDVAKEQARTLLEKCPEINMFYCHDNYMSQGVYELLEKLGRTEDIVLIGIGNATDHMKAVREGRLYGLVTQPPEFEAYYALDCAKNAANGVQLRSWCKNQAEIITKDNVDDYESPLKDILEELGM